MLSSGAMLPSGRWQSHCLAEARHSHIWLEAGLKSGAFLERKGDIGFRNASEIHFQIAMQRIEHIVHNLFMDTKPLPRYPITCEIENKTHKGTYWVAGKILTVSTGLGGKSKQVGTMEFEALQNNYCLN